MGREYSMIFHVSSLEGREIVYSPGAFASGDT